MLVLGIVGYRSSNQEGKGEGKKHDVDEEGRMWM